MFKTRRRGNMPREPTRGRVYRTLRECMEAAPMHSTGRPYRVGFKGVTYYVWTSSSTEAGRVLARHLGMDASPVGAVEIMGMSKGGGDDI